MFGSSKAILQMNRSDYVVLPVDADFSDTTSSIAYDDLKEDVIARVDYFYNGVYVGSGNVEAATEEQPVFDFGSKPEKTEEVSDEENIKIIDMRYIIQIVVAVTLGLILLFGLRSFIVNKFKKRRGRIRKYKTSGTKNLDWKGFLK